MSKLTLMKDFEEITKQSSSKNVGDVASEIIFDEFGQYKIHDCTNLDIFDDISGGWVINFCGFGC